MSRRNRRASTKTIRDNTIFSIRVRSDGYFRMNVPMHYRRRFISGRVYTGPVSR